MTPLSNAFISILQDMFSNMFTDSVEIRAIVDTDDGYGISIQKFIAFTPPLILNGSLRTVERIPGEPNTGDQTPTIGNFILRLPAGSNIPDKVVAIVNGNNTYIIQNPYNDKGNRLSDQFYCYRVL